MDNNMDFGFSSNPDNGNKERQNRFIFSDDYYDSIASSESEAPSKPVDAPVQFTGTGPSLMEIASNGQQKSPLSGTPPTTVSTPSPVYNANNFTTNNPNVSQASSFEQVVHNDYNPSNGDNQNVFDFFGHNAHTDLKEKQPLEDANFDSVAVAQEDRTKKSFFNTLEDKLTKRRKNSTPSLEVVHVGDLSPVHQEEEENNLPKEDLLSSPASSQVQPDIQFQQNFPAQQNFPTQMDTQPQPQFSTPPESQPLNSPEFQSQPISVTTTGVSTPEFNTAVSGLEQEYNLNDSSSFADTIIPDEKIEAPKTVTVSSPSFPPLTFKQDQEEEKAPMDFLLKKEDIPTVEKNVQYDQKNANILDFSSFRNADTPAQFITNQEPNIRVEADKNSFQQLVVPDFMSGTVKTDDLNIATGVNEELEKELMRQKQEEEEEKKKILAAQQGYDLFKKDEPKTELIYKAGGKSIIREKREKPKNVFSPTSISAPEPTESIPVSSVEEVHEELQNTGQVEMTTDSNMNATDISSSQSAIVDIDQQLKKAETPPSEVKSIQDLIEQIVGVPDLDSVVVPIDPKANPGVNFRMEPIKEEKEVEEEAPTNVYDEEKDNFDYDQSFTNVKVHISELLPKLKEKATQEGKISILARYGEDFCAREYITNPAIGRAEEIKQLILILLTPEKSGILVGKPGIGKTSIVEGLAYQLQRDNVPDALKGYCIVSVKTPSLLGTLPTGETRLQTLVDELKGLEKIILFIDEIHMLIGSTNESAMDFANMFKESLGRGSIKVIGATTTEEYERYILRDKAFVRRFQKVEVAEPDREMTIKILMGTLPKIEKTTGAKLKYTQFIQSEIMAFIVDVTSEYKRIYGIGSRYPDICLTLLAQAFSQAVFANRKEVTIIDVRKAIENSKNIYPDVIKKELVRFDQKFKDIIREEEGPTNN